MDEAEAIGRAVFEDSTEALAGRVNVLEEQLAELAWRSDDLLILADLRPLRSVAMSVPLSHALALLPAAHD